VTGLWDFLFYQGVTKEIPVDIRAQSSGLCGAAEIRVLPCTAKVVVVEIHKTPLDIHGPVEYTG
jgi:hypothetical protein